MRILVADTQECLSVLSDILAEHDLLLVKTRTEGQKALAANEIDLCVVGVHFDDSQAIKFIQMVQAHPLHKACPIVMVRALRSDLAELLKDVVASLSDVIGKIEYIDLEGNPNGAIQLREAVSKVGQKLQEKH